MTRPAKIEPSVSIKSAAEVVIRQSDGDFSKSPIGVERRHFYKSPPKQGKANAGKAAPRLVIGFDTEYVPPETATSRDDLKAGKGIARPVSYQVWCRLVDETSGDNGKEWGGVFYPLHEGHRYTLGEVITYAVWSGVSGGHITSAPRRIELVSHFSRADMPMLEDFPALVPKLESVRNVFVTMQPICLEYSFARGPSVKLDVSVSDTFLLTAAGAKKLSDLGDVVGVPKVVLSPDPNVEKTLKKRMDVVLAETPELFERYALADAQICVRYFEQLRGICEEAIGESDVPLTLSGIGVKRLLYKWDSDPTIDTLDVLGKESVSQVAYNRRAGRYFTQKIERDLELVSLHYQLAVEAYHGGRGEQFWFGPAPAPTPTPTAEDLAPEWFIKAKGFDGRWTDFDLSSAYPTAMSLIGAPDWRAMRVTQNVADFTPVALGVALVDFVFPASVRYPCLPVRTDNGLVFPLTGRSYCTAPEISAAVALGAAVTIVHGVIVPSRPDAGFPFRNYIEDCIGERTKHPKGSLKNLFWKELTNSTYGKLAQGLRTKRAFSLKSLDMVPLKPSRVTNPYFAAFVTGYVRALLAEIMNGLPAGVIVFSCTTDGLLSTATADEMAGATLGPLASSYRNARIALTGNDDVVEIKHVCARPLGWRTRGQATLTPGNTEPEGNPFNYVLAKAGIRVEKDCDGVADENAEIVRMFFGRTPDDKVTVKSLSGIRDIVLDNNDLVEREFVRRLGMEYDFKRRPAAIGSYIYEDGGHVAWSTAPWNSVTEFETVRKTFEEQRDAKGPCIISQSNFINFALRVSVKTSEGDSRYVTRVNPDIRLLRRELCTAFHHRGAGVGRGEIGLLASEFASALSNAGIPCKRTDVENAKSRAYAVGRCADTPTVRAALVKLKRELPSLIPDDLVAAPGGIDLLSGLKSLGSDGRAMSLRLWKLPKLA